MFTAQDSNIDHWRYYVCDDEESLLFDPSCAHCEDVPDQKRAPKGLYIGVVVVSKSASAKRI